MKAMEVNFDGLVGPTHNYAGLSYGNVASLKHKASVSSPRQAALEGLAKMKRLMDLGVPQAVLPPQDRPDLSTLRRLGFSGSDAQVLEGAASREPVLLAACCSASGMWAANAATVSASPDTTDNKLHFTPANLASTLHRSIETQTTAPMLRRIFPDDSRFAHHPPLPPSAFLSDEGAANHTRLCTEHGGPGVEIFVFGRSTADESLSKPAKFPARQTLEASRAVARLHMLRHDATLFVQQNPAAIDAGVFHNDVACVGHRNLLLLHERTFVDQPTALDRIRRTFETTCGAALHVIEIPDADLPLPEAVATYLFNSQIVDRPDGSMWLIAPADCQTSQSASHVIRQIVAGDNPIAGVEYVSVRQSMRNGGGPACLRLRVVLNDAELKSVHPNVLLTPALYDRLVAWVTRHYRDELRPQDLADVRLVHETRAALEELAAILSLGPIYSFQRHD
jgi:succinylarginine dihydrolase